MIRLRNILIIAAAIIAGAGGKAAADYQYCASAACYTVFSLSFVQSGITKLLSSFVPIDQTGTPIGTQTNKFQTTQTFVSAGAQQKALPVSGVTQLTVPTGALCAEITVEGAPVRRTSDTSTPSASSGTLISQGAQWQDCGPLAAYSFYPVSGSPTLDVEYFK